ncbi:acyloxyacyl hydrolase [Ramlibacter solisilvae]|uniref:Lipid A deacylase n=1 Tax=Ramlibacter tataouinensis TaxID=94132 RepID=A0A127JTR7_9BURK|nr:acyloxyacyl hydrolase [Ramlibacter tataouinensis]AMO23269.1 hypothetical protein UC35_10640 [Ramlibacter tataouinensis]
MEIKRVAIACMLALCACAASAAEGDGGVALLLEGGAAGTGRYIASVGLAWPWSWRRAVEGGEWTGVTELFVSHLSSRVEGGRESRTLVGLLPLVRYRFNGAHSNWFGEAGIGLTYMDALYRTENKQFSTQFNFMSTLGVGRSFGAKREQELSLRIVHISNAGIKNPNPGENFLQLRWSHAL